jgi:hypothetical protein
MASRTERGASKSSKSSMAFVSLKDIFDNQIPRNSLVDVAGIAVDFQVPRPTQRDGKRDFSCSPRVSMRAYISRLEVHYTPPRQVHRICSRRGDRRPLVSRRIMYAESSAWRYCRRYPSQGKINPYAPFATSTEIHHLCRFNAVNMKHRPCFQHLVQSSGSTQQARFRVQQPMH